MTWNSFFIVAAMQGKTEITCFLFFIQYIHETNQKAKDVVLREASHCELHLQTKL